MTKLSRSIVLFGEFASTEIDVIGEAAAAIGVSTRLLSRSEEAASLIRPDETLAVVIDTEAQGAAARCTALRNQRRLALTPILGATTNRTNMAFGELFHAGGDDLVGLENASSLTRRLRPLVARSAERGPAWSNSPTGEAVVASDDLPWTEVIARALSNAGSATRIATTEAEALDASRSARFVVASDSLPPHGAEETVGRARAEGDTTPWVIVAPPKRAGAVQAAVAGLPKVAVVDAFAPPENALFVANELLRGVGIDQRTAPRLLYGTRVAFRVAGRDETDEVGFTYNVSRSGVFVRTLAPLAAGDEAWLELGAPRSPRLVRLAGKVAWRRPFGPNEAATVPPGFGVQILDGLREDLATWKAGCEGLERDARVHAAAVS